MQVLVRDCSNSYGLQDNRFYPVSLVRGNDVVVSIPYEKVAFLPIENCYFKRTRLPQSMWYLFDKSRSVFADINYLYREFPDGSVLICYQETYSTSDVEYIILLYYFDHIQKKILCDLDVQFKITDVANVYSSFEYIYHQICLEEGF